MPQHSSLTWIHLYSANPTVAGMYKLFTSFHYLFTFTHKIPFNTIKEGTGREGCPYHLPSTLFEECLNMHILTLVPDTIRFGQFHILAYTQALCQVPRKNSTHVRLKNQFTAFYNSLTLSLNCHKNLSDSASLLTISHVIKFLCPATDATYALLQRNNAYCIVKVHTHLFPFLAQIRV